MLSAAMLLDHVEQRGAAQRLRTGVAAALARPDTRTGDLGGRANTAQFTDAVIRAMNAGNA
jgi:isocitrate/isopropylmalate dehydrogenase